MLEQFTIGPTPDPMPVGFRPLLAHAAEASVNCIDAALAGQTGPVPDGMRYAVRGGKAIRAFLVLETARLYGVDMARALPAAAAIESLHAYSLVHDDLPCMDDDALRRGQPTVHVKWDEATAVLVGGRNGQGAADIGSDRRLAGAKDRGVDRLVGTRRGDDGGA
jgi:farnesyl diphosphate synthase